ncbi:MAG: hypothetical protein ABL925_10070, partial [Methylococcales bacterium]
FVDSNQAITIHHVLLSKEGYHQSTHNLVGTCQRKQNQAAYLGLDLLRRYLQKTSCNGNGSAHQKSFSTTM